MDLVIVIIQQKLGLVVEDTGDNFLEELVLLAREEKVVEVELLNHQKMDNQILVEVEQFIPEMVVQELYSFATKNQEDQQVLDVIFGI
jgi:hypothetical protein